MGWEWRQIAVGKQQTLFSKLLDQKYFAYPKIITPISRTSAKEVKNKPFQMHIYFYANLRKLTKSEVLTK